MTSFELNLDGLVGPTHQYSALSVGNRASMLSGGSISRPREAALQGLAKMKFLADQGVPQAVLPPQERPDLEILGRLGFEGSPEVALRTAASEALPLLRACSSASSMWAANAATTTPSVDALDGRVHFTPANLVTNLHRSIEAAATGWVLRAIFPDSEAFAHHDPLPASGTLSDEGAANHMRLAGGHESKGLHIFVFGRRALSAPADRRAGASPAPVDGLPPQPSPERFPARQTREASEAIARLHQIDPRQVLFVQQNPEAIDQGIFHNDVIATANESFFFYHESAFLDTDNVIEDLRERYARLSERDLSIHCVREDEVSVSEAVKTYLFNSQIVTLPGGDMLLLAAEECRQSPAIVSILERLVDDPTCPVKRVAYMDLNQSMRNGGGPACLRLRVVLTQQEMQRMHPPVLLTQALYERLRDWVLKHYRERLRPEDLGDPQLLRESRAALEDLTRILHLGPIYHFQQ